MILSTKSSTAHQTTLNCFSSNVAYLKAFIGEWSNLLVDLTFKLFYKTQFMEDKQLIKHY